VTRAYVLAIAVLIAWAVTHRPAVGCALIGVGVGLLPQVDPPADMREHIEARLLDEHCRACPERRRGKERWLP